MTRQTDKLNQVPRDKDAINCSKRQVILPSPGSAMLVNLDDAKLRLF